METYEFGKILKNIRTSKNMSLRYVEKISGVSATYLWRLEEGNSRCPTIPVIVKLAEAYNLDAMELLKMAADDYIKTRVT